MVKNNPNYVRNWTNEEKAAQSVKLQQAYKNDPSLRYKVGKANRGVKFSQARIYKMHGHRTKESYRHEHSEETKKLIGIKSSQKYTVEYRIKDRKIREDVGLWIPLENKTDWEIYKMQANWIEKMFDLIECPLDFNIVGIFNCRTNTAGYVRDHLYSRFEGFKNAVFPEILRHPANCQIILHKDNLSKRHRCNILLEELFTKIQNYDRVWTEQSICIKMIEDYTKGLRWTRQN
jgi:hypothetical protein